MRGHIWWLGLKYVSSQMAFCGLCVIFYVGILTFPLKVIPNLQILENRLVGI